MVSGRPESSQTEIRRRSSRQRRVVRRAILSLLVVAACLLLFFAGMWTKNLMASDAPVMSIEITVRPGDTLWSVAKEYGDPSEYILQRMERLARVNNIKRGEGLREGQTLVIPVTSRCARLYSGGTYASRSIAD